MTDEKAIAKGLLEQNGIESGTLSDGERNNVRQILVRDRARVKRLKWIKAISWATLFLAYLGMIPATVWMGDSAASDQRGIIESGLLSCLALVLLCTFVTAVVCTVSLFIRSRSLSAREIKASLDEISAQLKRLAEKE